MTSNSRNVTDEFTAKEILYLRSLAAKPKQRWWKNYALIISILAFLLSLTTSTISIYTSHRKNLNDQLSQLTSAIQTIQDLSLKQVEIHEKYKSTTYEKQAGGLLTSQINNSLKIARDLAFNLGTNASTAALSTVALGLYGLGDISAAQKLFTYALDSSNSAADESIALRSLGFIKIRNGTSERDFEDGQGLLSRAANLEKTHSGLSAEAALWLNVTAQLQWAAALAPLHCDLAREHFTDAVNRLNAPIDNFDLAALRSDVTQQTAIGIGGTSSCKPTT